MNLFLRHRAAIALTLGLLTLTLLAGTGLLALAGHFLTAAALAGSVAGGFNLFGPSAGIRALTFARILSRYGEKLVGHDATLRLARDLRVALFARLLPLAPLGLGRHRTGDLLGRLMGDIDRVDGLLVRALGPLLALLALCTLAVAGAWWWLPQVGGVLALATLAMGVGIPLAVGHRARPAEAQRADAHAAVRSRVLEGLEGAADLAAMEATAGWIARVDADAAALARCERARKRRLSLGLALQGAVAAGTLWAVLWKVLQAVDRGALSAPAAAGLFFMTVAVLEALAGASLAWQARDAAMAAWRRLQAVAEQPPAVRDAAAPATLPRGAGLLELDAVTFRWPGQARPLLDAVRLRLPPGRRIALCGDSGAGKSSLMALLLRLVDPAAGQLRYAGIDLRQVAQADWHRQLAWLPQDAPVFAGRVRDNLALGEDHPDDTRLWHALAQVRLEQHVRALPDQLDTWVGESGATLSAGQARRLALARALLRDAPILLLDEPTEGLDVDTAHALLQDLARASGGRSVLIISHDELPPGVVDERYRLVEGRLRREP